MNSPQRFALEKLPDGGILLDLQSGSLYQVNPTAAFIWERSLAGVPIHEVARELAATFDVSAKTSETDALAALHLPESDEAPRPTTMFRYEATSAGYRLWTDGVPALEIDSAAGLLRPLQGWRPAQSGIYLRALTAKLVALQGFFVLHAAAISRPDGTIVAFLGESGAGKTTTARALARSRPGWGLVSEDKVILKPQADGLEVALGAEAAMNAWTSAARTSLLDATGVVPIGPLAKIADGPTLPVAQFIGVNALHRQGTEIALRPLAPGDAAASIFSHSYVGSATPGDWRRHLRATVALSRMGVFEATMPEGLAALAIAVERYTDTIAS